MEEPYQLDLIQLFFTFPFQLNTDVLKNQNTVIDKRWVNKIIVLIQNKTVLIADDDLDVLESTQYMLLDEGYNVVTAHNGEEAINVYKIHKPDIVLLDIRMPVLDGYEAFFSIKKYDTHAKVIFITAFSVDNEKAEKAKNMGLLELLHKPIEFHKIIETIQKYY